MYSQNYLYKLKQKKTIFAMSWWKFGKKNEKKMKTIKKKNGVACSVVATLQWECNTKKEALKSVVEIITLKKLKVLKFW